MPMNITEEAGAAGLSSAILDRALNQRRSMHQRVRAGFGRGAASRLSRGRCGRAGASRVRGTARQQHLPRPPGPCAAPGPARRGCRWRSIALTPVGRRRLPKDCGTLRPRRKPRVWSPATITRRAGMAGGTGRNQSLGPTATTHTGVSRRSASRSARAHRHRPRSGRRPRAGGSVPRRQDPRSRR